MKNGERESRRLFRARPLDDQPVLLGLAVAGEIEGGLLVALAQIEVAACYDELIAQRQRLRHDLAGGGDDARAADQLAPHLKAYPKETVVAEKQNR